MSRGKIKGLIDSVEKFKKMIGAEKIILFGSYARGEYDEHSDVDLILVSKNFEGKKFHSRFKGLWLKWKFGLPVDFIPLTPREFERQKKRVSIVSEALKEGIKI